jgi:hypothetical protein
LACHPEGGGVATTPYPPRAPPPTLGFKTHGTREFSWNARNLLEATGGAISASYSSDAFSKRIGKVVSGVAKTFVHDGYEVVQESVSGSPVANNLGAGLVDELLIRTEAGVPHSTFADGLGSVIASVDTQNRQLIDTSKPAIN